MSEAPRDGTEILLYVHGAFRRASFLNLELLRASSVPESFTSKLNDCWIVSDDGFGSPNLETFSLDEPDGWLPFSE